MRLLVLILLLPAHGIISSPISSSNPEGQDHIKKSTDKIQIIQPTRTRRSITALLAAEVLFLEGILAAQNSKKALQVKARKVARPVNNYIHPTLSGKHAYPLLVKQDIPLPIPTTIQTTTTRPVSQLDPFVMLTAPDLSRNTNRKHETFQTYSDDIFPELNQTPTKPGSKREAKQIQNYFNKYGEFELYNPLIFGQYAEAENSLISTSFKPSSNKHEDLAERIPRKIIQKYGAFDLYEPSVVIRQNSVKGKRNSRVRKNYFKKKAKAKKKAAVTPFTFFHSDQVRAVHGNDPIDLEQVWGKVRRRSKSVKSSVD